MLPLGPSPLNRLKRARGDDSPDAGPEHHHTSKRQKRERTPPAFWNNLSRVPLCRRALQEYERRVTSTTPPGQPDRVELTAAQRKQLKRFARRGGPDCQDIIAYPEHFEPRNRSSKISSRDSRSPRSRRGSGSSKSGSAGQTKPTTLSSNDPAFEQRLLDHHVLTEEDDEAECNNLEAVTSKLRQERASLSPSQFPLEKFRQFKKENREAKAEADVLKNIIPRIASSHHRSLSDRRFTNFASMTDGETKPAQPDLYEGSPPSELARKVREDLAHYIVPSSYQNEMLLPNHFTEVKGPDGKASQLRLQATYDAAHGSRAMHQILSYEQDEQRYDGYARSFASTYHSGTGTLQLYASHATAPTEPGGDPTYRITQLDSYGMTGNYDTHRAGLAAYRNVQDLAKEERDNAIAYANGVAGNAGLETMVESRSASFATTAGAMPFTATLSQLDSDTSTDELSLDVSIPVKRSSRYSKATSSSSSKRNCATPAQQKEDG
ncbi:hypothetical protein BLS_007924 [Venturia inaequalis]|uniref:Uncharacterized protein n=1 Tax=Venturia inaequalis TaxID=5025 RepID=A0A8H3U8W0_VENIN|nr:hypothetical protein BLS_007924 [Venturia inaequalis]KAE9977109.1 hypothetical protein EG327_007860 [Venturia inaequalis]KAE9978954.1 hypothetical protein EG328_001162 [Venturia inaequalis]